VKQHRQKRKVPEEKKRASPQQGKKSEWQQAVKDADREYRKRHGIGFFNVLKRLFGKAVNLFMALIVLAGVAAACYFGYRVWSTNSKLIADCQQEVLGAVNPQLGIRRLVKLDSIDFPDASAVFGVPEKLPFEAIVFLTNAMGGRQAGIVKGEFYRTSGLLQMEIDFTSGQDVPSFTVQLKPVPRDAGQPTRSL